MNSLSTELKSVIARRLESAGTREVLAIASALCDEGSISVTRPAEPHARFEVYTDTVVDNTTGLEWTRRNVTAKAVPHKDAEQTCKDCRVGDHDDWRLPTIKELLTLVDYERHSPAIDVSAFECNSSWYWSATPYAGSPSGCAWYVYFGYGYAGYSNRSGNGFVRAVRASQS